MNIVTVAWLVFAIVFFSFPYYMPVTGMLTPPPPPFLKGTRVRLVLMINSVEYELYLCLRWGILDD